MNWELNSDRPVWLQLVEHLQRAVVAGQLGPGSRVPPVREGLKFPREAIFGGHRSARAIRYFAVVLFAGILWPMTFPKLAKLGRKEDA